MKNELKNWCVYLLKCFDDSLYCGVTNDMENRLITHNNGTASKYTRSRLPAQLAAVQKNLTKVEAYKIEYRIKKLPAGEKINALKNGTYILKELRD